MNFDTTNDNKNIEKNSHVLNLNSNLTKMDNLKKSSLTNEYSTKDEEIFFKESDENLKENTKYVNSNIKNKKKLFEINKINKPYSKMRTFKCGKCEKTYFSFSHLYTHDRNKHSLIPITSNKKLFKNKNINFNYSKLTKQCEFQRIINRIMNYFEIELIKFYKDKNCILYDSNFKVQNYIGIKILKCLETTKIKDTLNPNKNSSIDEVLIIYIVLFCKITDDVFILEILIRFSILFREFVNIIGWDYKMNYQKYGIDIDCKFIGYYSENNGCEDIPDYINDFISVFVNIDKLFIINQNDLIEICQNFCDWLLVKKLTNLKILLIKENVN